MKKLLMLCLSSLLMLSMLTACGGNNNNQGTNEDGTVKQELTVAVSSQFTTLDTGLNTETVNNYVLAHTAPALFKKVTGGEIVGDLATDYTVSEDGLVYTVNLRQAKWSDGVEFTANDVKFGILRNLTYGPDNAWAIYNLQTYLSGAQEYASDTTQDPTALEIEGVQVLDDYTIQFTLTKPCAFFTTLLTNNVFKPLRADFINNNESLWAMTPGYPTLGAYSVSEVNANEKVVITKNPEYFNADSVNIEKITFMVMPDADAQALAFQTGEIDVATGISTEIADSYHDSFWDTQDISAYFLAINSGETGPDTMKDVNVRRALAISIDKAALTEVIGASYYKVLNGYVPNGLSGINGDFREEQDAVKTFLNYDPEEAKALLEASGYNESNPLKISYKYSSNGIHGTVAEVLQQMWAAVGIECKLEVVEAGVFYAQLDAGDFEIARYGYSSSTDASTYLDLWTQAIQVEAAVADDWYDEELSKAGYLTDNTEYMTRLHELEEYLVEEMVYVIPLFNYSSPSLKKDYVTNVAIAPGQIPDFSGAVVTAR